MEEFLMKNFVFNFNQFYNRIRNPKNSKQLINLHNKNNSNKFSKVK